MVGSSIVSIKFPIDSDIIGVPTTTSVCLWDTRKPFLEFWPEMCQKMGLDQGNAKIGYKISGDRVREPARQLSKAEEYEFAMEGIRKKVKSARTKEYKLILHNLVRALHTSSIQVSSCTATFIFTAPKTIYRCLEAETRQQGRSSGI